MNIFDLTQEWLQIMDMIAEAEGEVTEEIELLINKIEGDISQKFMSMRYIIKSYEARAKANKEEIERLEKNVTSSENAVKRMKETMIKILKVMGDAEISKTSGEKTFKFKSALGNYSTFPTVKVDITETVVDEKTGTTKTVYEDQALIDAGILTKQATLEFEPSKEIELKAAVGNYITKTDVKLDRVALLQKLKDKSIQPNEFYKIDKSNYQIRMT